VPVLGLADNVFTIEALCTEYSFLFLFLLLFVYFDVSMQEFFYNKYIVRYCLLSFFIFSLLATSSVNLNLNLNLNLNVVESHRALASGLLTARASMTINSITLETSLLSDAANSKCWY